MLVQNMLEKTAARIPNKLALICGDRRHTYTQIDSFSNKLANALIEFGVERQDRVIIFAGNSIETVISIFGVVKADSIFIVLNFEMKSKKLKYILKDSGAKTIIADNSKAQVLCEATEHMKEVKNIVWVKNVESNTNDFSKHISHYSLEDILYKSNVGFKKPKCSNIDIDLASIIYTSGSTGYPKGVMEAHYNIISAVRSITQYIENTEEDIILDVLPLSFDYGLYQVMMAFYFGGTIVLEKSFVNPNKILEYLIKEKITGFPIVPTLAALLFQIKEISTYKFSSLRYISNTAAALPSKYIDILQKIFPEVKIFSMYGLTECKRVSYLPPEDINRKKDSVGIPMPNLEAYIVDGTGQKVGAGEVGELVVRGSSVMQGYWKAPEDTVKTFKQGKYFGEVLLYTGDKFKKDKDGYLYFVSRKDDMIKTRGERVSPKEIENILCEMDEIIEVAVIGIPDDNFGQAIKAFIVKNENDNLNKGQIIKHCMKNMESFMIPKYIEFINDLPKSPNGKIDKKMLK